MRGAVKGRVWEKRREGRDTWLGVGCGEDGEGNREGRGTMAERRWGKDGEGVTEKDGADGGLDGRV